MTEDDDRRAAYYDADESHRDPVGPAHKIPRWEPMLDDEGVEFGKRAICEPDGYCRDGHRCGKLDWPKPFRCDKHQIESNLGCPLCATFREIGGEIDLGIRRDTTLNSTNDLKIFAEEWLQITAMDCKPCVTVSLLDECTGIFAESWSWDSEWDDGSLGCQWRKLDNVVTLEPGGETRSYAPCGRRRNHRGPHGYGWRNPVLRIKQRLSRGLSWKK